MKSAILILQPRRFYYKRKHKNRKLYNFKINHSTLKFGSAGVLLTQPLHLTSRHLFRLKLFFKRAAKKSDYTKRFVWLQAFPHLPLTKKPTGTRMGKGKGKLECWFTNVHPGIIFVELKNLRRGRATYYLKQLTHKLGIITKTIFTMNYNMTTPLLRSKNFFFKNRW